MLGPALYKGLIMLQRLIFLVLLSGLQLSSLAWGQQLMWERTDLHSNTREEAFGCLALTPTNQLLVAGGVAPLMPPGCNGRYQALYQTWDLMGTLLRERPGRWLNTGEQALIPATGGGYWWTATEGLCQGLGVRPFVQRLSATGDTLRGWSLASSASVRFARSISVRGNTLLTGVDYNLPQPRFQLQVQQYSLSCSDTSGQVRWQRDYPMFPLSNAYNADIVFTPRGGYLLSGMNQTGIGVGHGFQVYLVETDSLGNLRRQRIIYPLGPNFTDGRNANLLNNLIALPNAGGYLLAGYADSLSGGSATHIGYVLRLDTALNVMWTYRNPAATNGNGNRSQYGYKVHLLPNGTVGALFTDVHGVGTPDVYLVQLDLATGRRVQTYTLSSNSERAVIPFEWVWLGDGTLVLAGKSLPSPSGNNFRGYLARWDFRGTPLAAKHPMAEAENGFFTLYPNPSTSAVTLSWQLPPGQRAARLGLYSVLGQLVREVVLPAGASGKIEVSGLMPGTYLARLLGPANESLGRSQRLVIVL
jgi:hypothetical protein